MTRIMTRTAAREIAVHFSFELCFTGQSPDELLEEALTRKTFASIGEEEPLYAEFPNEIQRAYISALVKGVYDHMPELDAPPWMQKSSGSVVSSGAPCS